MKKESDFPFEKARRVTPEENQKFRQAISQQFGIKLRNRDLPAQNDDVSTIHFYNHYEPSHF